MHIIRKDDVDMTEDRMGLITDASTARIKPGEWPDFIVVVDANGRGFTFGPTHWTDGDAAVIYDNAKGYRLVILND